ncbi:MAG: glycoside hydrolase family 3 protein [Muribaculaceae bacterium]|nr:glycoside hydrolase family 3 protein [Muribaculaceae bacterium]
MSLELCNIKFLKREITFKGMLYLVLCFILCSCQKKQEKEESHPSEEIVILNDRTRLCKELADSLLTTLTLEERAGQCFMPSVFANTEPATIELYKKYIEDYHVGGIVLLKGTISSAKELANIGHESKIPLFIAIDAEWGLGMRLEDAPVYPKNGNIGKDSEDTELFDYGLRIAEECREVGINMVLGPVVDITAYNGGVIGKRSFGNNPKIVSDYGVAYAKGLESGGVISVAKHFPGHGSTIIDTHKGVARVKRDITALDSIDLKPFKDYINVGLTGVMAGHIQSLALDPDGNAATVSMDILTSLLRDEMGFKGLVLTDAFDMGGAKGFSAEEALKAGADIILSPENMEKEYRNLLDKVKTGQFDLQILNDRCRRILFYKYLFNLI